jgi:hypothetical protein
VGKDPNHIRDLLFGSLISETHFPHCLIRTPLYFVGLAATFVISSFFTNGTVFFTLPNSCLDPALASEAAF